MNIKTNLNHFYSSEPIPLWKQLIGEDLLYSFGDFSNTNDAQEALKNNTRNFYPYIPEGAKILDLGCGWGGPAKLLQKEKKCGVTGVTISETQYKYCTDELGLKVLLENIETISFSRKYDVVWMMESLEHITNIPALLKKLSLISNTLLIQTNCAANHVSSDRWTFGNSMYMYKVDELKEMFHQADWKIIQMVDRRLHSVPTFKFWRTQLEKLKSQGYTLKGQMIILEKLVKSFEANPIQWCKNFPLMDIIAIRT